MHLVILKNHFQSLGTFPVCWKLGDYFSSKSKTEILDQTLNPPSTTEPSLKAITNSGIQFSRKETITIQSSQVSFSQETAQTSCIPDINSNSLVDINSNSLVPINSNSLVPINSNSLVPINSSPSKNPSLFQVVTKLVMDYGDIKQSNEMILEKLNQMQDGNKKKNK